MRSTAVSVVGVLFSLASFAVQAETDWSQVDAALGRKGAAIGTVRKYGLPRSDLHVTLDGVDILPPLALGGWVAFEPKGEEAVMMGDLVLTESEINPVMSALLGSGVQATAVHNHLLRASPATFYMHVAGQGDPVQLAGVVRRALLQSKTPLQAAPAGTPPKLSLDTAQIEQIIGFKGQNNGGVFQIGVPRADAISMGAMPIPPAMGTAIPLNFEPTGDGRAAISGDFVALASEVGPLLKALRANGIEVTAVHNHMLDEEPRAFFVHFWANDDAVKLARGLRAALDTLHVAPRS